MYYPPNNAPPWPQPTPAPSPRAAPQQTPPNAPNRMPAAEARRRASVLKRWVLAGATLAFCALTGLAASHVTGITSANAGTAGSSATPTSANQDDNGSFFPRNGQGSDDAGQQSGQGGGFNFGSGGTFQPPAASSGGS